MITTAYILNFAFTHKVFTRKELISDLKSQSQKESLSSLSEQLDRLLKSKQLVRLERGVYALSDNARKEFYFPVSEELKQIKPLIHLN